MTDIDRTEILDWLRAKKAGAPTSAHEDAFTAVMRALTEGRFAVQVDSHVPDVLPELPEGCLETGRTIVRSYLDSNGKSLYTIHTRGERSKFDVIGSLEVAKHDILALGWGSEEDE